MSNTSLQSELSLAKDLARQAGKLILSHYHEGVEVETKEDQSPVTQADKDAKELVVAGIGTKFPGDAILAEESTDSSARFAARRLWCVDPLDGTKEFIDHNGMFVVMIGLAIDGEARLGVVYQPTEDLLLWGVGQQVGAEKNGQPVTCALSQCVTASQATMVVSRSHRSKTVTRVAERLGVSQEKPLGSVGLKVADIVLGHSELYVSTSNRMQEWDTCAPEAILRAAGGLMTDVAGNPMRYNKPDTSVPKGVLASNGLLHADTLEALAPETTLRGW